jgi:hypothetical protein
MDEKKESVEATARTIRRVTRKKYSAEEKVRANRSYPSWSSYLPRPKRPTPASLTKPRTPPLFPLSEIMESVLSVLR